MAESPTSPKSRTMGAACATGADAPRGGAAERPRLPVLGACGCGSGCGCGCQSGGPCQCGGGC
ncbi:hypothetical protein [Streptomyces sp. NRRL F-5126]|uniref:hypothetical protein n=1 Tax=Streptomyces sp. NRRL F-5126 TaxID=1463857 RepID=UPI0004CC2342|nr:hypothetical protein [Streptomyces sp. NRRL F-5126]